MRLGTVMVLCCLVDERLRFAAVSVERTAVRGGQGHERCIDALRGLDRGRCRIHRLLEIDEPVDDVLPGGRDVSLVEAPPECPPTEPLGDGRSEYGCRHASEDEEDGEHPIWQ